jgi:hypothetical protein
MNNVSNLDGRHKLAILGAIVCWGLSVWFSYLGFRIDSDKIAFVGWILALVVTVVELVFNSQTGKLSLTLVATGILCYAYGIWTNITGFWSLQHPGIEFIIFSQKSIMPAFVGIIMEVLPEPLFMWGLMSNMDGDFLGNMVGLWNGKLSYAQPSQNPQTHNNQSAVKPVAPRYTPSHRPDFNPAPRPSYDRPQTQQNHVMSPEPKFHPMSKNNRPAPYSE